MQSDSNQARQDDESSQVEHTNGQYISTCVEFLLNYCVQYTDVVFIVYVLAWNNFLQAYVIASYKVGLGDSV